MAEIMRRLLTGNAVVFNLRHKRTGHLFQNRYKSIVCDKDPYLLALIRCIHLNPIRAGMAAGLEALALFPWCGHGELLGRLSMPVIQVDEALALFSRQRKVARQKYNSFMNDGLRDHSRIMLCRWPNWCNGWLTLCRLSIPCKERDIVRAKAIIVWSLD